MITKTSTNSGVTKLPKLLGKRDTPDLELKEKTFDKIKSKLTQNDQFKHRAKILKEISEELITEKTIQSSHNGENKVLYRKNIHSKDYRDKIIKKKQSLQRKKRENSCKENGTIHWTSFNFPPKKTKKLTDILNISDSEGPVEENLKSIEAIKQIYNKATDLGVMDKPKPKQYFFHTDEQQQNAEMEILKEPESVKRFNSIIKTKKIKSKKVLCKIQNLKVQSISSDYRSNSRFDHYSVNNLKTENKATDILAQNFKRTMNMSVDDYKTCVKPRVDVGRKSCNQFSIRVARRETGKIRNKSVSNSLNKSVDTPMDSENLQSFISRRNNRFLNKFSTPGPKNPDYSTGRSIGHSASMNKLQRSQSSRKIRFFNRQKSVDRMNKRKIKIEKQILTNQQRMALQKCEEALCEIGLECFGILPGKIVSELYHSKCKDLKIDPTEKQFRRFLDFCRTSMKGRSIKLRDCGFGTQSCKIFSDILKNYDISKLDLRQNIIGNKGVKELCKGIKASDTLIHIDLGSNDITNDGANHLFNAIMNHQNLYSFNLANVDGLHRNRLGLNGCKGINKLLKNNKVLAMIDIADNSIGNEGIRHMLEGVDPHESNLVFINLSNNGLSQGCINELANLLNSSSLKEIRLSENLLNDSSAQELAYFFYRGKCKLAKLDLSDNHLTSNGVSILSHALKLNPYLSHLNLENNELFKGEEFSKITILLKCNKVLKSINLSKCGLGPKEAEDIAAGLSENRGLLSLNLSKNKILSSGAKSIFEALESESSGLQSLDLSSNTIESEAVPSLIKTLEDNISLQRLNLYNNMITEDVGRSLSIAVKNNQNIKSLNLAFNTLDKQDMRAIKEYCKRNIQNSEKLGLPAIRDELVHLMQTDEGITVTEQQILDCVKRSKGERFSLEKEFIRGQDNFELMKENQKKKHIQLLQSKSDVEEKIDELEITYERLNRDGVIIAKKFQEKEEDMKFKVNLTESLQNSLKGQIQKCIDQVDVKKKDIQGILYQYKRELERTQKMMLMKKLVHDNLQEDVTKMKEEIEQIKINKEQIKSISTLRRTKTSYYKSCKSIKGSPCKSCSPMKKYRSPDKKKILKISNNIDYGVNKESQEVTMTEIKLFGDNGPKEIKTPKKKKSRKRISIKRKLTVI
ncbi:unnamed protein product [Moneuplotes crassus]|uniref:Leucine-rich repeat-containing protein n=1 Tax=Euplotes crassus TaxID=5936 RepID=A0AAD1XHG7_EUPCR|nr:unnamed protein product [Moneuplotes crassus]